MMRYPDTRLRGVFSVAAYSRLSVKPFWVRSSKMYSQPLSTRLSSTGCFLSGILTVTLSLHRFSYVLMCRYFVIYVFNTKSFSCQAFLPILQGNGQCLPVPALLCEPDAGRERGGYAFPRLPNKVIFSIHFALVASRPPDSMDRGVNPLLC